MIHDSSHPTRCHTNKFRHTGGVCLFCSSSAQCNSRLSLAQEHFWCWQDGHGKTYIKYFPGFLTASCCCSAAFA